MGRSEFTTNTGLPTPHMYLATPDICFFVYKEFHFYEFI